MHRSGTSVVARILNLMGCYFGPEGTDLAHSSENAKGFWERKDVMNLNHDMLSENGLDWFRVSTVPETLKIEEETEKESNRLLSGIDAFRPWFIKDPRLCITLPVWLKHSEVPLAIIVFRHPVPVALSLESRNNIPIEAGTALWEKYNALALKNTDGIPRLIVSYDELMANPIPAVERIFEWLVTQEVNGIRKPSPKEISAFIQPSLKHHSEDDNVKLTDTQRVLLNHLKGSADKNMGHDLEPCNRTLTRYEPKLSETIESNKYTLLNEAYFLERFNAYEARIRQLELITRQYLSSLEAVWKNSKLVVHPLRKGLAKGAGLNDNLRDWHRIILESPLFDRNWYMTRYDIHEEPEFHYLLIGAFEGKNPASFFDSQYYLNTYPEVLDQGLNPLIHYIREGALRDFRPSAHFSMEAIMNEVNHPLKNFLTSLKKEPAQDEKKD